MEDDITNSLTDQKSDTILDLVAIANKAVSNNVPVQVVKLAKLVHDAISSNVADKGSMTMEQLMAMNPLFKELGAIWATAADVEVACQSRFRYMMAMLEEVSDYVGALELQPRADGEELPDRKDVPTKLKRVVLFLEKVAPHAMALDISAEDHNAWLQQWAQFAAKASGLPSLPQDGTAIEDWKKFENITKVQLGAYNFMSLRGVAKSMGISENSSDTKKILINTIAQATLRDQCACSA